MIQRRTPSGQGPARRPDRAGRAGSIRGGGSRGGRQRDPASRAEPGRASGSARGSEGPRSANRPAAARRAGAGGAATRTSAPRQRRYTGRATVLVSVLIALSLAYTYPVRVYLNQQSNIARIEAAQQAQRELIGDLSEEAALWQDPDYIKIQARERFFMVLPGEVPLVVLTDPKGAARDAGTAPDPAAGQRPPDPWYDTLWSSVQAANQDKAAQP